MLIIPEFWILIRASSAPILEKAWIRPEHSDPNKAIEERIWIRAVKARIQSSPMVYLLYEKV